MVKIMKKILICSHWMEIGGAERALLGLLYSIDYSRYQVDLYLCRHTGEFMSLLPKEVNLLPEDKKAASIAIPAKDALKKGCWDIVIGRILGKIKTRQYLKKHKETQNCVAVEYSNKYTYKRVAPINPEVTYDLLISFLEPHYIAVNKAKAKKKVAWMHTDYSFVAMDTKEAYNIWNQYDKIAAISKDCWIAFAKKFPQLENKLFLMNNILHPELIRQQAIEFEVDKEMPKGDEIRILSMGRYCYAKNFDNVPDICRRIREKGFNIKWYLIGYGGDEALILDKIKECQMEKYVIMLGKKVNPYPYIASCDIYIQPSRYEGNCVTVHEAQMLGKPVVITNYPTSASQLEDGVDGVIVPMDNVGCAEGITKLLCNPVYLEELKEKCRLNDYSNCTEVEKLYRFMED